MPALAQIESRIKTASPCMVIFSLGVSGFHVVDSKCEVNIVKDTTTVVLLIANAHTTQDHEEESIKYLSHTTHKQKWL